MKFRHRMLIALAAPAAVVLVLGAAAVAGIVAFETRMAAYFAHEDALAQEAVEMYAQGLQTGQAIRNILLEPANPKAYENRKAAAEQFEKARGRAQAAARTGEHQALLARIDELRAKHRDVQDRVAALVKADPEGAAALLRKSETPLWRELKDVLLKLKSHASGEMQAAREETVLRMAQARGWSAALSLVCLLACAGIGWALSRLVDREIGGEPDVAREALARVESGDLETAIAVRPGDSRSVMAAVRHMQERLVGVVGQVRRTAHTVSAASDQITQGNQELSSRTEEQASAIEQTSATMEQLGVTVHQNAEGARDADRLAREAAAVAERGGEVVHRVVESMKGMNAGSQKMAEIVGVIDGIAFQTNILALNAAVEAARAGEQGRGFAVVASEVRSLAQRSATAAKEIKQLIDAGVDRANEGAALADKAGEAIGEVVASVKRVSDAVERISRASDEQSAGVSQVGEAIQQMDQVTQQNATLVEQSASAADSLMRHAHELDEAMAMFRTGRAGAAAG